MKRFRVSRSNAVALVLVLVLVQFCASSPAKIAYTTIGLTKQAVDLAMHTWADYVVAGHATQVQEDKVRNAHDKYRGVARALGATLEATNAAPTPAALSDAAKEIVALVQQFTGKKLGGTQ